MTIFWKKQIEYSLHLAVLWWWLEQIWDQSDCRSEFPLEFEPAFFWFRDRRPTFPVVLVMRCSIWKEGFFFSVCLPCEKKEAHPPSLLAVHFLRPAPAGLSPHPLPLPVPLPTTVFDYNHCFSPAIENSLLDRVIEFLTFCFCYHLNTQFSDVWLRQMYIL